MKPKINALVHRLIESEGKLMRRQMVMYGSFVRRKSDDNDQSMKYKSKKKREKKLEKSKSLKYRKIIEPF